jgi:hypothetical protein
MFPFVFFLVWFFLWGLALPGVGLFGVILILLTGFPVAFAADVLGGCFARPARKDQDADAVDLGGVTPR